VPVLRHRARLSRLTVLPGTPGLASDKEDQVVLIRGGVVVDAGASGHADVRTADDGRISEVDLVLIHYPASRCTMRAEVVIPGGIDAHTHLHMPVGTVRVSDDFVSGTRAAAIAAPRP